MNRRTKPDEKQRELPLFIGERITVPKERQVELEVALAELLLRAVIPSKTGFLKGGGQ
jgi:hypothetical protein